VDAVTRELEPTGNVPDAAAVEAALLVVPGVARASVVPDGAGGPGVLRLVLEPASDEVVVARSVQRILRLQFGVGLDPGRIEVVEDAVAETVSYGPILVDVSVRVDDVVDLGAEINELLARLDRHAEPGPRFDTAVLRSAARHPAGASPSGDGQARVPAPRASATPAIEEDPGAESVERVAISRLTLAADGLGVVATVTLQLGERELTGTAEGPSSSSSVHRVVAAATLEALADFLGPAHRVDVEAVTVAAMGEGQVAVVQVVWATAEGVERLTGASEVRDDPRQAVIRATLDAVNRRLAPHLDI
jgi:hypothetical protein